MKMISTTFAVHFLDRIKTHMQVHAWFSCGIPLHHLLSLQLNDITSFRVALRHLLQTKGVCFAVGLAALLATTERRAASLPYGRH
jgi:hypothetical protein